MTPPQLPWVTVSAEAQRERESRLPDKAGGGYINNTMLPEQRYLVWYRGREGMVCLQKLKTVWVWEEGGNIITWWLWKRCTKIVKRKNNLLFVTQLSLVLLRLSALENGRRHELHEDYWQNRNIPQFPSELKHDYNCKSCTDVAIPQLFLLIMLLHVHLPLLVNLLKRSAKH